MNPDNELVQIERQLQSIRPAAPGARLRRRLESAVSFPPFSPSEDSLHLTNTVHPPRSIWRQPWFQTAAAALVGAAAVLAFYPDTPQQDVASPSTPPNTASPITPSFPMTPAVRTDGFQLTGHENRIFDAQDEGIVFSKDQVPFRRVQYNTMDRRIFRDPETGAVFELVVPRKDVLIVPAETF